MLSAPLVPAVPLVGERGGRRGGGGELSQGRLLGSETQLPVGSRTRSAFLATGESEEGDPGTGRGNQEGRSEAGEAPSRPLHRR